VESYKLSHFPSGQRISASRKEKNGGKAGGGLAYRTDNHVVVVQGTLLMADTIERGKVMLPRARSGCKGTNNHTVARVPKGTKGGRWQRGGE